MRAVIYARYSSDNQREESIEGQLRDCNEYAKYNDIEIVGQYIDRAFSAKTDDRPDFQRMIADSAKRLFDVVLVWKLDRFARNRYDSAFYRYTLRKNGVKIISVKENISEGPEGIILESMLEGIAEFYSANLSQNVKRGFRENALKGKWNGGSVPFGYKVVDHRLALDEDTSPIVALAFQMCADGYSAKETYDFLKTKGLRRPNGKLIAYNSVLCSPINLLYEVQQ
ncbi:MAG: recombinase family protein [Candidatus Coproplasma sp.]